jgi:hypothetical protein
MDFLQELTEITDMNYKTLFPVFFPFREVSLLAQRLGAMKRNPMKGDSLKRIMIQKMGPPPEQERDRLISVE